MNARILALAVVVLSGCTAPPASGPPETGSDVRVDVSNEHADPVVITVGVAPAGHEGLAVELVNGTVREYPDASGIEDVPQAVVPRAVSLRPIGDDVETRTYRWDATAGSSAVFEDVPLNATVFYSVASPTGDEPMRTLGRLNCSPESAFVSVSVRVGPDGVIAVGNACRVA